MTGLCRALLRNRTEAEDAAQQVFLSAHRALLNGSEPREPAAWLATITRNECWARISARMREPLPSDDVEPLSSLPDPLAEAIRRADLAALWRAIEELPRQQRDALLLREFAGLSYEELGTALAVSGPAVESLLFRARRELRARLQTAYAAVTGASWLEGLLRLAGGSSGLAVPAAAKLAAVGIGAAVLTGGAAVPVVFAPHHAQHAPTIRRTRVAPPRSRPPAAVVPRAVPLVAVGRRDRTEGDSKTRREGDGDGRPEPLPATPAATTSATSDGGDRHDASASGGGDGQTTTSPATTATVPTTTSSDGDSQPQTTTDSVTTVTTVPTVTTTGGDGGGGPGPDGSGH